MGAPFLGSESRVAVLVDCDNTSPAILDYASKVAAQFGRAVIRRGYGNYATLANKWKDALVHQAFTPHLQYQYAAGKNTSDIALALDALEALFDQRADHFCLVTSDSDFAYLCRKLHERGATVSVVGEAKTPLALRNASDQFFEWSPVELPADIGAEPGKAQPAAPKDEQRSDAQAKPVPKRRPKFLIDAVALLTSATPEGKVHLGALGQYLKRTDPGFSPTVHGHSGLLDMIKTYDLLALTKEQGGHYTVRLRTAAEEQASEAWAGPA
jgi:uncharacterized protein (TIGR00288 family)